jgi:hypothetical protein
MALFRSDADRLGAWFLDDLGESRAAFLASAKAAGAAVEIHPIAATGPSDEPLSIAVARLGAPQPRHMLVLISGVHGVEGPAGAAIQLQFLVQDLARHPLANDMAVLLIHAANPFGWAWGRRATEGNVDLNRNFADFADLPDCRDYAALDVAINPPNLEPATLQNAMTTLLAARTRHGGAWLQTVVSEGQYRFPKGLHYGGSAPVEANPLLLAIARRHLADAETAVIVDLHTGLGSYGDWMVIGGEQAGSPAEQRLAAAFAPSRYRAPYGGAMIDAPATRGKLARALSEAAVPARVLSLTLEFGTHAVDRVFLAEMLENILFHHGGAVDKARAAGIMAEMRECYTPADPQWRARVLAGGSAALSDCRAFLA